eukprot:TRINITY_DN6362_c0_g1_i1.p1 TRINITY_DN6362_c0_g1~~TRINITY_DN6362_c0_g1_i1.p1  ORF type:complete len:180 (-),score=24.69 TRINITY_DN6362_c0_g1_i1:342-881(-)
MLLVDVFFFFKQKTAYEISACLVGSEMCIRDRRRVHGPSYTAKILEAGMSFGKLGDIIPVIMGGYSVYQYNYDQAIKSGADESTAYNEAILAFEMATDRTQQAGHIKDLGEYQAGGSMARLFTMFTTSPRQYYMNISSGVLDAKAGKISKAEAAKKTIHRSYAPANTVPARHRHNEQVR